MKTPRCRWRQLATIVTTIGVAFALALTPSSGAAAAASNDEPVKIILDTDFNQTRQLHRDTYLDRLHAMWLGETIANWTGIQTELKRTEPPFYTDDDWDDIGFVTDQDPWLADDDTDIEYVYLHLATQWERADLTAREIAAGWQRHINRFIWVSNAYARGLMSEGVLPPTTGMNVANPESLAIDAQLTTELFGAFAPGMPEQALRLANIPIRTTADGHATHASQFFVLLYSLAPMIDQDLAPAEQMVTLGKQARRYIPDTSKAADIFDFVLAEYVANPDKDDWELTRDRIYERYQRDAAKNGFVYRYPVESSINFAAGIMAMLYGQGDYKRTVQIGALAGWDSDNATATLGGLIGLMRGTDYLRTQFPDVELSDRYNIYRTRDNLPDYRPQDPQAEDTFTAMAERMLPLVEGVITKAGGTVGPANAWMLPDRQPVPDPSNPSSLARANPVMDLYHRSSNNQVRLDGGKVTASVSQPGEAIAGGTTDADVFADGEESDFSGTERFNRARYFTTGSQGRQVFTVTYDRVVPVHTVRFVGGAHTDSGGWLETARVQLRLPGGSWVDAHPNTVASAPMRSDVPYQLVDFQLGRTTKATGIRLVGQLGDSDFAAVAELDALSPPSMPNAASTRSPLNVNPWVTTVLPDSAVQIELTLTNTGNRPWTGRLELDDIPAGWSVSPHTGRFSALRPGETASANFEVTAPVGAAPGSHVLSATAYVGGLDVTPESFRVVVLDPMVADLTAQGSEESNSIQLTWSHYDPNGDSEYLVYASTSDGFVAGEDTLVGTTTQREFLHTGLGLRETWYYRVRVVDGEGNLGPLSQQASATTGSAYKIEAESLLPLTDASAPYVVQTDCCGVHWSGGKQIWFQANAPGDHYTLTFTVPATGDYDLSLAYTKAPDFGIHSQTLDGAPLGPPYDHYNAAGVSIDNHDYGQVSLTAGAHTLTFTVTGKNSASPRYGFGLDAIQLTQAG